MDRVFVFACLLRKALPAGHFAATEIAKTLFLEMDFGASALMEKIIITARLSMHTVVLAWLLAAVLLACSMNNRPFSKNKRPPEILQSSWKAYVDRFIQKDGRVIDYGKNNISTSEGQAYAMLRAVWIQDREIFDKSYIWARNNLNAGYRNDHLWAWKWGKDTHGKWGVLDQAFASDADQDAVLALIMASKTWREEKYLDQARAILADLWNLGTLQIGGGRYLLAGDSLCQSRLCKLNPSYYAAYAYRIFTKVDPSHNWMELVDTSYFLLEAVSSQTETHLPTDWIHLNTSSGQVNLLGEKDSVFSYDAFRVYWRIALDKELFQDPRAENYLSRSLTWITREWEKKGKLPAVISRNGKSLAEYESLEMLAGLMPALQTVKANIAAAMNQKLQSTFQQGNWADKNSYYLQNWAWFGTALYQKYVTPFELL